MCIYMFTTALEDIKPYSCLDTLNDYRENISTSVSYTRHVGKLEF